MTSVRAIHTGEDANATRIALVEDDADAREVLADLLRDEGYEVVAFGDGAEAFKALRAAPAPDLILLDLRLPGMDGWEFRVHQKREPRLARTPVIALSADRSSQAQAIDADEFLEKPPRLEKLLSTITGVLERAAERRRRENQVALESMAAVGQLSAGVAHEINNPLAYVCGNLHVMREELARVSRHVRTPPDAESQVLTPEGLGAVFDEIDSMLTDSLAGAERIRDIVRDMRLLARVDDPVLHAVELHPVIESALGIAHNLALGTPRLERRFGDPPLVLGNEGRLVHVFWNLIANAFQAIPDDQEGEVLVETLENASGNAVVRVRDNGVGIPQEIRARIFEPFFTTRSVGAGKGLGLSVCLGIVTALGGSIDVESSMGKGSTFTVTLPAAPRAVREPENLARAPESLERALRGERARVLVIDDEPAIGRVLARVLGSEFDVTVVTSGRSGLEHARTGDFDAILCDLQMDDLSGADIFTQLAAHTPGEERKLVFMSGGTFADVVKDHDKLLHSRILDKPLDAGALVEAVRSVVGESKSRNVS